MQLTGITPRTARAISITALAVAVGLIAASAIDIALAQGNPFGVGPPKGAPPPPPATGVVGWIMAKQAEFYKGLTGAIRAAKTDWSALWVLFGLAFGYGIFHAAGPGHGKAVISSYVVANRETWWRGVVLSFASAMVQAAVAVAIVAIAAGILNVTATTMRRTTDIIEIASYSFIMAIGTRLFCVKGVALIGAMRGRAPTELERAVATLLEAVLYVAVIEFAVASIVALTRPSPLIVALAHQVVGAAALWLLWTAGSPVMALWKARKASKASSGGPALAAAHHGHAHHDHSHHDHSHHDHAHHDHAHAREAHAHHGQAHGHGHAHNHGHAHHDHGHAHHNHGHHDHAQHGHKHDHASAWGHAHAPEPQELAGPGGWRRGLSATIAVGLRPCSGAILVLVFTLSQGIFWAGVAATFIMGIGTAITVAAIAVLSVVATGWAERFASGRGGFGMILMRGIEVAAALVITCFGALLLLGYMASERLPL